MKCGCGIDTPDPVFIGIQEGSAELPKQVLWNCAKGSTHGIFWPDATDEQRKAGINAELFRHAGLMG